MKKTMDGLGEVILFIKSVLSHVGKYGFMD
jgi:hypothetical protein